MNLRDYKWSHNTRGLQNKGPFRSLDTERYIRPQMGWAALVVGSDEYDDEAAQLVESGVTPIVRIHRSHPGALAVPDNWYDVYQAYLDAGVRWFELYSEPNSADFWPQDADGEPTVEVSWENEACIEPLMDNWLDWAERIIEMGGYPAFPALAPDGQRATSTVYWLDAFLRYLTAAHYDRFMRVVASGLWAAAHPQLSNHFYQEPPGGPPQAARPYYQQSADEGGWHFEYPYDPISQRHDPGRTVFRGTGGEARYGDVSGLVAAGEAFVQLLRHHLDAGPVPVVSTAGGILPVPERDADPSQPDDRYPPYNHASHAEAVLAMWKWIARQGPPWFFGACLSDESTLYETGGTAAAIERAADEPPLRKEIPDIDTGGAVEEPAEEAETIVVDGEVTPVDEGSPEWLEESERQEEIREAAREESPPEGMPTGLDEQDAADPGLERLQTRGLDHDAEEMIVDAAEGREHPPSDEYDEGEIPDWLAEELPPEELQELIGEGPEEPSEESLEELVAIDAPEEPVAYDQYDVDETAAEEGRPESEVDPEYKDLTGQVVDAWQQPETAGTVPDIRLDDLPEDMQEQLAALTGAEAPEDLAEMTEQDEWRDEPYGDHPDDLPRDLEETEDILLGTLGTEPIPPEMEEAMEDGEIDETSDRATSLTEALFEAGEIEEEGADEFEAEDEMQMPWEAGEGEDAGVDVPPAAPVAHPHQGTPSENIKTDLFDMTGEWSEEGEGETDTSLGAVPAGELPSVEEVEQRADEPPISAQAAIEATRDDETVEITHHWLVCAPGVDPGWFFDAGARYWQTFRPAVVADWEQLALIPVGHSVALTVLVPSEDVEEVTARIHTLRPDALVDAVEADSVQALRSTLDGRATSGRRLG